LSEPVEEVKQTFAEVTEIVTLKAFLPGVKATNHLKRPRRSWTLMDLIKIVAFKTRRAPGLWWIPAQKDAPNPRLPWRLTRLLKAAHRENPYRNSPEGK